MLVGGALAVGEPVHGQLGDAVVVHHRRRHHQHVEYLVTLELGAQSGPLLAVSCCRSRRSRGRGPLVLHYLTHRLTLGKGKMLTSLCGFYSR